MLAVTVCGAVDAAAELGSLVCFDDLHFLSNRLPDGSLCTFFTEPGAPERGHWIYESPFSPDLRAALLAVRAEAGVAVRDGGCYGHVDGPRFNTARRDPLARAAGVTAVSQTAGPETVLCGEAELPYALLGFLTDYANGVNDEATPVDTLVEIMAASTEAFAAVLRAALPLAAASPPAPPGMVYRFAGVGLKRRLRSRARARSAPRHADRRLGLAGDAEVVVAERLAAHAAERAATRRRSAPWPGPPSRARSSEAGPGSPPASSSSSSSPRMIVVKASSPWSASWPTKRSVWRPRGASRGIASV